MKKNIYKIVQKGSHGNKINLIFDYVIIGLIILSIISLMMESVRNLNSDVRYILRIFDIISIIIFSVEYIMRLYVADLVYPSSGKIKSRIKFIFSVYGIVDLLAILPFYLPMLITMDLRFLRILRLTRFFRILKINRYNNSISLILSVIKEKRTDLSVTCFVTFIVLLISSFFMYHIEGEVQPEAFPDVISTFWWAVTTLTTVGYGDIYPITTMGRILSGIIALIGIGIVALPTGIISSGFIEKIGRRNKSNDSKKCPHCGKEIKE